MLIVFLTNRKDYEPFLADVVFAFDGLEDSGIISHRLTPIFYCHKSPLTACEDRKAQKTEEREGNRDIRLPGGRTSGGQGIR